jgi:hypothetical protein
MRAGHGARFKVFAAIPPVCAWIALAFAAAAHGSDARGGAVAGPASTGAQDYCADLQEGINAERFRFSGWRCKQGPAVRGLETILGWVTMTESGGKAHVELVWVVETEPVEDAQVIDARNVPRYGYVPGDVRAAFRAPTRDHLSA